MTLRLGLVLRATAILIAVAAAVDPVWSVDRPQPARLVAIDLADGDAAGSIASLSAALPGWEVDRRDGSGPAIPCAPGERCVIVADGSIDAHLPGDLAPAPALIAVRRDRAPNVALRSATAPSAHVAAAGAVRVEVQRAGAIVQTEIVVRDGSAVVGSSTHTWGEDFRAVLDVAWWPLAAGARALRVEAIPVDGEPVIDNVLDIGVTVLGTRVPVLVFDGRPSWNSTFVRRALEDDPRLAVEYRGRVAPALSAGTRSGVLDASTLEITPVVVAGDPDALTQADVALLERFVRVRGGSLVLLPERRVTGPAARLMAGEWTEHLLPSPGRVGTLRASELLRARDLPVAATVLATSGEQPSIVSAPLGHGRVIVSGAMDAWRFRDAGFDSFWRSLVVEAGLAGAALQVEFESPLGAAGARVPFTIRSRSFEPRSALEVNVVARCGGVERPVRVWPSGAVNEFKGELPVDLTSCELQARAADRIASAFLARAETPARGVEATLASIERSVRAAGGTANTVGDEAAIARHWAAEFTATSQVVSVRPMRSPWWMFPFAVCVSIEWFLRRRHGLR